MSEHITLTPTSRLTIEQDESADNPRADWEMITGAVNLRRSYSYRSDRIEVVPVHDCPAPLLDAYDRFDDDADTVTRWARTFYCLTLVHDTLNDVFWFCDRESMRANWPDLTPGTPEYIAREREVIAEERATYEKWCEGSVYIVSLERLVHYVALDDEGTINYDDAHDSWESVESLGGNYLDDEYTAQTVALESFDWTMTPDEIAACNK